jgi:hypothetical protein
MSAMTSLLKTKSLISRDRLKPVVSEAWRTLSDDGQEEPVDDVFQVEQRGVGEHQEDYVGGES